jgi:hypothetical protein
LPVLSGTTTRAAPPCACSRTPVRLRGCSGLVPLPEVPGDEGLTARRPSSVWEAPSRPPMVWVLRAVEHFVERH